MFKEIEQINQTKLPRFHVGKEYPLNAILNQWNEVLKVISLRPDESQPWVPLGFEGIIPIWGHYEMQNNDFWGFPQEFVFKVLIEEGAYLQILDKILEENLISERKDSNIELQAREKGLKDFILETQLWKAHSEWRSVPENKLESVIEKDSEFERAQIASEKNYSIIPKQGLRIESQHKENLPESLSEAFNAVCYLTEGNDYYVVMEKPDLAEALTDRLNTEFRKGAFKEIIPVYAVKRDINELLSESEGKLHKAEFSDKKQKEDAGARKVFDCDLFRQEDADKMLDDPKSALAYILENAIRERSSDVHIQLVGDKVQIRFRTNTYLHNKITFPKKFLSRLNSIITQYGGIDTFKKLFPHSGRFTAKLKGSSYDIRVSIMPYKEEQSTVLRIHSHDSKLQTIDTLGLNYKDDYILRESISRSSGIILITGPTGSGKSTTLYAALSELNNEETSVETIEDPVERHIEGIKQFQVRYSDDPEKNLSFPRLFREVLRHDPDVVMVGEIRDLETAKLAINAAQTGHLVLSTLHTQDALGAIPRLLSEGVDPQHLADSLILLQAQRLVGVLCKNCREKIASSDERYQYIIEDFNKNDIAYDPSDLAIYEPGSCELCSHTGYEGKTAIYELFPIIDTIRELIATKKPLSEYRKLSNGVGHQTLYQEALQKVALGITSYQEALKYQREFTIDFTGLLKQSKERVLKG